MSIRNTLTFRFASIFALILILFSLTIYYFTSFYRQHDFFNRLQETALATAHMLFDSDEVSPALRKKYIRQYHQALADETVQVYDAAGKLVFSDGDGKIAVRVAFLKQVKSEKTVRLNQENRHVTGIFYPDNQGDFVIIVSSIDQYTLNKLGHLKTILIVGFLCAMLIVIVAGWVFSKEALRPISKIITEAGTISGTDLQQRLTQPDGKDELWLLAFTFNKMLDRLESSFEMQSTFVSSASHELRTPLTAMTGEIEVALMQPREPEEYRRVLESILDDARRLGRLSNGLLQIAQASTDAAKIKIKPLRFDELLWSVQEEAQKRHPSIPIKLTFETYPENEEQLLVTGNESLLHIALLNVFENAGKFSKASQEVTVLVYITSQSFTVRVIDQGIGIGEADLVNVFVPFFRSENVRNISGHGIGLPLAEKIIKLHKGSIRLVSHLHKGTEVIIKIPAGKF